jgi:hypothetical protein
MPLTNSDESRTSVLAIPRSLEGAAGDVVQQAFERLLASDLRVTTAAEAKRLLAGHEETEEVTDAIQRFVGIATRWRGSHFAVPGSRASRGCSWRRRPCRWA